ncbi:MAG: ammonia-forming cytochrome c nitrite reductase subunit c552 [Proteobacteria bacterium]|nr:ammonia-forming cytochrome c nitrite reductase subunit c552 [Pseudomonadota bacterium]MCL2308112.1 ammonia-forming cytochrome c nitrite reductase subunit c552 [Pseudomonadota bacterium]
MKHNLISFWRHAIPAFALGFFVLASPAALAQQKSKNVNVSQCYACHQPIQEFHAGSAHKSVNCVACHDKLSEHLAKASARPTTNVNPAACGTCHKNQFDTAYKMNTKKVARHEKALNTGPTPDPAFTKLMLPHGFTKEHAEPRSHAFMVVDQYIADRAFGGRFKPKEEKGGWRWYGLQQGGNFAAWDILEDKHPGEPHKAFKPGYTAAANPVCMSCKSQDHILDWAYMGDPHPNATFSRASNVIDVAKAVNYAVNCFMCHDPHSAKPRVVRDALIDAITRPGGTLFHTDPHAAKINVKEMGLRGFTRKIATLDKYDMNLQCGQCHVEYNCNPGIDMDSNEAVTMADRRTNYFPFVNVFDLGKTYNALKFRDFRHAITGARLWKAQHPDVEVYYGSKHQLAGVQCNDCHMPKVKDKAGKPYTVHWVTSPKNYIKETCLVCHSDMNETQAVYTIDVLKGRYYGKLRHVEFWLTRLVDKIEEARNLGIDAALLTEAQEAHWEAHIHWEWWGAVNGAYFHNQDQSIDSMNLGMDISQKMITKLDAEMAKVRTARK